MVTKQQAHRIATVALEIIQEMPGNAALDLVLFEEAVQESALAWVFPFNTREYAETGALEAMAIGMGPLIINRSTGIAFVAPPLPLAQLLAQYEAMGGAVYNWF